MFSKHLHRLRKSKFLQNLVVATTGNTGAQLIIIGFAPILTRLYTPEAFGLFGTFTSVVAMILPIAALSYPIAIVLPRSDEDAKHIASLSLLITVIVAIFTLLIILCVGNKIALWLNLQEIEPYLLLIPLVLVFNAWLQVNQQWFIRKKYFSISARIAILQAFLINSAKAIVGLFKPLAAVLITLYAIGDGLHAWMLSIKKDSNDRLITKTRTSKEQLLEQAKKHYDFPLYRAPQVFINAISHSLPIIMLSACFGPVSAGLYALAIRLLYMPSQLIGKAVSDVFYPHVVEAAHKGENISILIVKTTLFLTALGITPFAAIIIFQ